jgi:cation transport regulator
MPYASNEDLPPSVRAHLPPHAQDISGRLLTALMTNVAAIRAEIAFRIAWAAVKRSYHKVGERWLPSE